MTLFPFELALASNIFVLSIKIYVEMLSVICQLRNLGEIPCGVMWCTPYHTPGQVVTKLNFKTRD